MKALVLTNIGHSGSRLLTDDQLRECMEPGKYLHGAPAGVLEDVAKLAPGGRVYFAVPDRDITKPSREYCVLRLGSSAPLHPADVLVAALALGTFVAGLVGVAS